MNKYMEVAIDLANDNLETNVGGPFGACVVKDGKIIGKGSNHVLSDNDPTAHAEIVAIREACKKIKSHDLSGCEIYTSCYPCPMCLSAIIWANIDKVYYGNTKEDAADIGFRDDDIYKFINDLARNKDNDLLSLKCLHRSKAIESFKNFSEKEDKNIY